MWQISRMAIPWLPSALVLVLLSACASGDAPQSGTPSASPSPGQSSEQAAPTAATASPSPTDAQATPAASPTSPTPSGPSSAGTPTQSQAPGNPTQPAAGTRDGLHPTYRAEKRMAGFSPDGRHYLYLESSRDTGAGIPKSSLQVVDVASNTCAENSCIETQYQESEASKLKTNDGENELLKKTWKVRQDLKLTPPIAGRALPIVSRSQAEDGSEVVTVRLEQQTQPLQLRLRQKQIPASEGNTQEPSRAAMQLDVSYNGQTRSLDSLDHFRDWVTAYSIREVHLSPDGTHVAVLITATRPTFEGTLGTTIVQGFKL